MLNDARKVPYEFRVVEIYGWVWLYDNSERSFVCDQVPKIYLESLYPVEDDGTGASWLDVPEEDYFGAVEIEKLPSFAVLTRHPDDFAPSAPRREAWDAAREEANANRLI